MRKNVQYTNQMEAINFGYSNKNIPIAPHNMYLGRLVEKTEQFLRRMRWKAFFFSNPCATKDNKETYGFKSRNTPPAIQELREFENGMINLIQSVEFKQVKNNFQNKLKKDLNFVKNDTALN